MNKKQFTEITEWQRKTFGDATSLSKLEHLKQEIQELENDIINDSDGKKLEFADCFILLFGAAASNGMTYDDICLAIDEKMEINYKRKWGNPDAKGVVNHIEEKNVGIINFKGVSYTTNIPNEVNLLQRLFCRHDQLKGKAVNYKEGCIKTICNKCGKLLYKEPIPE